MPSSIADTYLKTNAATMRELIGTRAMLVLPQLSPVFRDMIIDPGGKRTGAELRQFGPGRDFLLKKRYRGSLAGVIRPSHKSSFYGLVGDTTTKGTNISINQLNQLAPNPLHGANPTPYGLTMQMFGLDTNLALSATMARLDATEANIRQHIPDLLKGMGSNIGRFGTVSWHLNPSQSYRLGSLGASTGTGAYTIDATAKTITFTPVEKTVHYFAVGQEVDLMKSTTRINEDSGTRELLFVHNVLPQQNKVILTGEFASNFATWATTGNIGADAFVVFRDTYDASLGYRGFYSWRDWAVWGGSTDAENRVLRGSAITTTSDDYLDLRDRGWVASLYFNNVGSLTERKFLSYLSRFWETMSYWQFEMDTILAAPGIFTNIFETLQPIERRERQGVVGSVRALGRGEGFAITDPETGRTYEGFSSPFFEDGVMLGMLRKGNWAIITPPGDGSISANSRVDAGGQLPSAFPFEFTMPSVGHDRADFPLMQTDASGLVLPSEFKQLPGKVTMQFIPTKQIPMLVLEGVNSTRPVSN
jgi:hypothetical protein